MNPYALPPPQPERCQYTWHTLPTDADPHICDQRAGHAGDCVCRKCHARMPWVRQGPSSPRHVALWETA